MEAPPKSNDGWDILGLGGTVALSLTASAKPGVVEALPTRRHQETTWNSDHARNLLCWVAEWRQPDGVIAQCNSARPRTRRRPRRRGRCCPGRPPRPAVPATSPDLVGGMHNDARRHCCVEPECAGKPSKVEALLHGRAQERVEPFDRAHDLSSLGGEVEAVARGDRSMQQCPRRHRVASRYWDRPAGPELGLRPAALSSWRTAGRCEPGTTMAATAGAVARAAPGCRAAVCPATSRLARGEGEIAWSTGQTWRVSTHA
jgi:hypothetical protein